VSWSTSLRAKTPTAKSSESVDTSERIPATEFGVGSPLNPMPEGVRVKGVPETALRRPLSERRATDGKDPRRWISDGVVKASCSPPYSCLKIPKIGKNTP